MACVAAGYHFHPFGLPSWADALIGLAFALSVFLFEVRLQRASLRRLIGAAVGSILGILGSYLMGLVLLRTSIPEDSRSFLDVGLLLVMTYIGLVIGANKGDMLNLQALGGLFGSEQSNRRQPKVFDTSVIIDGRIADVCEVHFLEGALLLPQFVLRELQLVADSADSLKRQRGRRGLEVLQRIQKMPHLEVEIVEDDFTAKTPQGAIAMKNILARFPGKPSGSGVSRRAIAITGHFDTKFFPGRKFVGASDGGSSTGLLLELARVLAHQPRIDVSDPDNLKITEPWDGRMLTLQMGDHAFAVRYANFVRNYSEIKRSLPGATTLDLRLEDRITVVE